MKLKVTPAAAPLSGDYDPPGDKSISHRLAILGGLAVGETRIVGYLDSADTRATLAAMVALGAEVTENSEGILIRGGRLRAPREPLDLGNSGTGMRLLCGALAGRPELAGESIVLIGDESLSGRPMERITRPLAAMGAQVQTTDGHAPLNVEPGPLKAIRYQLPVASAQVKSAVLLAGLVADGDTVVIEPGPSRDHTERLLPAFGVTLHDGEPGIGIRGGQRLHGGSFRVPGDLSSAAFILAAAILVPDSEVRLDNVGLNPTRDGVIRILRAMGARLDVEAGDDVGAEPVGRMVALGSPLGGIDIPIDWVGLAIDEFPIVMAMAAAASGTTRIQGAAELRVKESDRLSVMCRQLTNLGVSLEETPDGAVIEGGRIRGGEVDSAGDHRIAMSLAILGLIAEAPVIIDNAEWIRTSYPGFVDDLRVLGAAMEWVGERQGLGLRG
jgi:3-phosphoshikimate 1-carboxyvinyltransferase